MVHGIYLKYVNLQCGCLRWFTANVSASQWILSKAAHSCSPQNFVYRDPRDLV